MEHVPSDPDDKGEFGFGRNVVVILVPGLSKHSDLIPLLLSVFLYVVLGTLKNLHSLVTLNTTILEDNEDKKGKGK